MQIHGPDGKVVTVDSDNRIKTSSVTIHNDKYLNQIGLYWSIKADETTALADQYFFYLKNQGLNDLFVTDMRIVSSVALNSARIDHVQGTASTGTDSEVTNRNLGDPTEITGIVQESTAFTGLTKLGELFFQKMDVADRQYHLSTTSNIIIPQGQAIAIRSALAANVEMILSVAKSQ